jgi:hypothetical protein
VLTDYNQLLVERLHKRTEEEKEECNSRCGGWKK